MKSGHYVLMAAWLASCGAPAQPAAPANPPVVRPTPAPMTVKPPEPAAAAKPVEPPARDRLSLAYGIYYGGLTGNTVNGTGVDLKKDVDLAKFFEAYSNSVVGAPTAMSFLQASNLVQQEKTYQLQKFMASGPENKAKGIKFMEANAKAPGVTTLTNGLQYKVAVEGSGDALGTNNMATLSFRALLVDGTEVLSIERRELQVPTPGLPPGYTQALKLMKAGSKWTVYLPNELAFGEQPGFVDRSGAHLPKVEPGSAMIFEVELDSFHSKPPPQPPARAGIPPAAARGPTAPMNPQPVIRTDRSAPPAPPPRPPVQTSSDIVRVPPAEEYQRGSNIEVLTLEEAIKKYQNPTNAAATNAMAATNAPAAK